jgi:hypothetical protein
MDMVRKRKPVLIIDNGADSSDAIELLRKNGVEFIEYDIRKFVELLWRSADNSSAFRVCP